MNSKKLKIAFIHPSVGTVQGGSETFAIDLAEKLSSHYEVKVLCGKKIHELCLELPFIHRKSARNSKNFFVRCVYRLLKLKASNPDIAFEYLSSIPAIILHLLKHHYDVLYPHNHWGGLLACSIVRKIKGVPILYTEHNSENPRSYTRHVKFKPDAYIAHTRNFYHLIEAHYPHINVRFIPNGVNLKKFFHHQKTKPEDVFLSKPIVLAVGEFIERKRLDLVIDAVAKLQGVSLLMISFGANLEKLNALGLKCLGPERFQLLSDISHDQMSGYYGLCDLFTLPSPKESFGLVYLEAMACNKPVVAPNDETRREIIGEAGMLCDVEDADEYASAIRKALDQDWEDKPLRQAKKFDWDIIAQRYASEINQMVQCGS